MARASTKAAEAEAAEAAEATEMADAKGDPKVETKAATKDKPTDAGVKLDAIRDVLERQFQQSELLLTAMADVVGRLEDINCALANLDVHMQAPPPAQAATQEIPLATAGGGKAERRRFLATSISKTADEKGIHIRLKGAPFTKFGVPVYEERFADLGIDADALKLGTTELDAPIEVIVELEKVKTDDPNEPERMTARRVVGLVDAPASGRENEPADAPKNGSAQNGHTGSRPTLGMAQARQLDEYRTGKGLDDPAWDALCQSLLKVPAKMVASVPKDLYPGRDLVASMMKAVDKAVQA